MEIKEEIRKAFNTLWENFKPKFKLCSGEFHSIVYGVNFKCENCEENKKYNDITGKFWDNIKSTYKELTGEDF